MYFVAYYEHWSSGSAAAVFDDETAAMTAFFENGKNKQPRAKSAGY